MRCGLGNLCKEHSILYLKWTTSSSGFQQPSNAATCYKDLKAANYLIKHGNELPPYASPVMLKVIDQLSTSGITGASLKKFSDFLSFRSLLMDNVFTKLAVQKEWKSAGFFLHGTHGFSVDVLSGKLFQISKVIVRSIKTYSTSNCFSECLSDCCSNRIATNWPRIVFIENRKNE